MEQLKTYLDNSQKEITIYMELLKKWQKAVNLIAPSTVPDLYQRHILDSAQLYPLIPDTARVLVDMGSGAGFPGLVLAILNQTNQGPLEQIILIESDTKKSLFLKEVVRVLQIPVLVLNQRIEHVLGLTADVVTARALAPVAELLRLGRSFITPKTTCLFLKGEHVDDELLQSPLPGSVQKIKSITNSNGSILKITEVSDD